MIIIYGCILYGLMLFVYISSALHYRKQKQKNPLIIVVAHYHGILPNPIQESASFVPDDCMTRSQTALHTTLSLVLS